MSKEEKNQKSSPAPPTRPSSPGENLARTQDQASQALLHDDRPEYLQLPEGQGAAGFEFMDQTDVVLPRLGLCQSGSPQRKSIDPKYIEDLKEGHFFNTITREIYGPAVRIVPLLFFKSRLLFGPMDQGGGLRCQAPDALVGIGKPGGLCMKCSLQQFGPNGERPECQLLHNYASLVVDKHGRTSPSQLVVFSLKSTGLSVAKDFNALMRIRQAHMYSGIYEVTNAMVSNQAKQTWFKPAIKNAGWVSQETLALARLAFQAVEALKKEGRLKHDVEDLNPEYHKEEAPAEM